MRSILLFAVLLGGLGLAIGQDAAKPPPSVPTQETKLLGTPPAAFTGRWLVVVTIELPDRKQNVPVFWDVRDQGGTPVVTQRLVKLPAGPQTAFEQANEHTVVWEPSRADLRAVAAAWDTLAADESLQVASITTEVATPSGYDDTMKAEPKLADALWMIRQSKKFAAAAAPAIQEVQIFAVKKAAADELAGTFEGVTLAAAPFPIPIQFNGTFRAINLDVAGSGGGFLAWIADQFAGCQKR